MKSIPLQSKKYPGRYVMVDDADYEELSRWTWYVNWKPGSEVEYAARLERVEGGSTRTIQMHRQILGADTSIQVDHFDGNGLNNQRSNLRACSRTENRRNSRKRKAGLTRFKGVARIQGSKKFSARIYCEKRLKHLGTFDSELAAAKAYNEAAKHYFGDFACLNEVDTAMN